MCTLCGSFQAVLTRSGTFCFTHELQRVIGKKLIFKKIKLALIATLHLEFPKDAFDAVTVLFMLLLGVAVTSWLILLNCGREIKFIVVLFQQPILKDQDAVI